ncbi:MAG: ABC-2 family transporter protein [Thermoflexales bacterium]|nr:ABC-2 family transporter protein [Thermoflexales bacterium]
MDYLKLIRHFIIASTQSELAYRANFWISTLHALLNLGTGVLGVLVLFGQVETVNGWNLASTLALLGVYLTVSALRGLFISPSLDALTGMDGEVWTGRFDFTLLRPLDVQFQASLRHWRPLALIDLALGLGVLVAAIFQPGIARQLPGQALAPAALAAFLAALLTSMVILYAILLAFAGLVFWSPGFLFTWVFDGVFQMARYPVGVYPGWLRLILTWVIPVGVITTVPAQALSGGLPPSMLAASLALALAFLAGATALFRTGLRRYASASS